MKGKNKNKLYNSKENCIWHGKGLLRGVLLLLFKLDNTKIISYPLCKLVNKADNE